MTVAIFTSVVMACHRRDASGVVPRVAAVGAGCESIDSLLYGRSTNPVYPGAHGPYWRIRTCPARGAAFLAALLDSSRHVSDTAVLEKRTYVTQMVHDASLLEVALAVAQDSSATEQARLAAIRTVIWQKSPGHRLTMEMMNTQPNCLPPCYSSYEGHFYRSHVVVVGAPPDTTEWPVFGRTMPTEYAARADSILRVIATRNENPRQVIAAAWFARLYRPSERLRGR